MDNQQLVDTLKSLPEVHLRLLYYAQLIINDNGEPDMEKVMFYAQEMTEATKEAEAYARATRRAAECLRELAQSRSSLNG